MLTSDNKGLKTLLANGMSELESLKTITFLRFPSDDVQNFVDQFGTLSIVTLGPIVSWKKNDNNIFMKNQAAIQTFFSFIMHIFFLKSQII